MIEGFYFRFFKLTQKRSLSVILAYAARFVFVLRFLFKRLFLKKEIIDLNKEEAVRILESVSADHGIEPDYFNAPVDESIDLSVVIPVYNHIKVLADCIESVLRQKTQYSYEVILVDDGSTDGAQNLIEQYRKNKHVTIIHQKNGGIAAARNTGISQARGKYIMFVDCDDTVEYSLVEELLDAAENDNCDIVMCGHNLVKKSKGQVKEVVPNIYPQKNLLGYKNGDEIMNYAGLPWAKVYKRQLFEKVRFFPGYWFEDTIVQCLLFTQCKRFKYIPKPLYNYMWYEENFSHIQEGKVANPKAVDRYWLLKSIIQRYQFLGLPHNDMFYTVVLKHISAYYYKTIASMPEEVIQAMFIAGRELLLQNKPGKSTKLPFVLRQTEKAIIKKDIALWKLCSIYQ